MTRKAKNLGIIGGLMIAGGVFISGSHIENYSNKEENYSEKLNNFLGKQSEIYTTADLEKKLKEEKEIFSKPLYITPDLLNAYIKEAYNNVKKWPKEFDKRLFRLMLKQESGYNVHAKNKSSGAIGLGQIMPETYRKLRPEEWEKFRNLSTGEIDTLAVERELSKPVKNIELSLEVIDSFTRFCRKKDKEWNSSDLNTKRKKILSCYNAGNKPLLDLNFNIESKELPIETRNYHNIIMKAYYDPKVKVKL